MSFNHSEFVTDIDYSRFALKFSGHKKTELKIVNVKTGLVRDVRRYITFPDVNKPTQNIPSSISYIEKDITEVDFGYILHVCNMKGAFGKGLAADIGLKYPKVKREYKERLIAHQLGSFIPVTISDRLTYINLLAQENYGNSQTKIRYLDYTALEESLTRFVHTSSWNLPVYVPYKMGCGLAGGDWNTVLDILRHTLVNFIVCIKPQ